MPPHCDSMDGPVVTAARKALDAGKVELVLPYVPEVGEAEVIAAFERALPLHRQSDGAKDVADRYFFETVVRVHRAGEGASFTGLKPAGLDVGPVIPAAEHAIGTGVPDALIELLTTHVTAELEQRFHRVMHLKPHAAGPVAEAREYVQAMLGLQVWAHKLYECAHADPHEGAHEHHHRPRRATVQRPMVDR